MPQLVIQCHLHALHHVDIPPCDFGPSDHAAIHITTCTIPVDSRGFVCDGHQPRYDFMLCTLASGDRDYPGFQGGNSGCNGTACCGRLSVNR